MKTKKVVVRGKGVSELPKKLQEALKEKSQERRFPGGTAIIFERYYLRNESDLFVVVIFSDEVKSSVDIEILCGGGSTGLLVKGDWGAEDNAIDFVLKKLSDITDKMGWKLINE